MNPTFAETARTYLDLVRRIRPEQWDAPGLGEWTLRSLVGHASRSLVTVESYLDQPATEVEVSTPAAYYVVTRELITADPGGAIDRGVQAGIALGDNPAAAVTDLVERVLSLVIRDDDPLITTIAGGMRLSSYLPTRTFELVVHGYDIARAAGLPDPDYSEAALVEVASLAARTGVLLGRGPDLVLALTGRAPLPDGFSVV